MDIYIRVNDPAFFLTNSISGIRSNVAQGDNVVLFLGDPRTCRVGLNIKF